LRSGSVMCVKVSVVPLLTSSTTRYRTAWRSTGWPCLDRRRKKHAASFGPFPLPAHSSARWIGLQPWTAERPWYAYWTGLPPIATSSPPLAVAVPNTSTSICHNSSIYRLPYGRGAAYAGQGGPRRVVANPGVTRSGGERSVR